MSDKWKPLRDWMKRFGIGYECMVQNIEVMKDPLWPGKNQRYFYLELLKAVQECESDDQNSIYAIRPDWDPPSEDEMFPPEPESEPEYPAPQAQGRRGMTDNTPETITVTIEVEGRRYSASVDFVPDGLTHETPVAEAVASALASLAATDGNLSLPCLMARVAEQNPAPSIVQAAAWVYRCSDIDVRGSDGWKIHVNDTVYPGPSGYVPSGIICDTLAGGGEE